MPLSDEDAAALIAELKREMRELERAWRETEAMKADLERKKRELERAKWEKGLQKRELERLRYETELEWLQSENVEMPMFPLLEGPQQSAPTAVALEAPAIEVMTDTRVFPDTVAPDASVERAAIKLTSAAGSSSKICGERRAFRYYHSNWPKHGSKAMRTFVCVSVFLFFVFLFFGASAWHRKPPQVYSSVVYTPRHAKTSSHSHP